MTFHVLDYGETTLDIDAPAPFGAFTYITNTLGEDLGDDPSGAGDPGNYQSELFKESSYFNTEGPSPVEYTLTITVAGSGTTDPAPGDHVYEEDTVVSVDAIPVAGWMLDHWELDGVPDGAADPYSVTMDDDHTLHAVFVEVTVEYTLTITVAGSGTTDPAPGDHVYEEDTVVPVTATAAAGWNFDHWELDTVDVGSANPIDVTMDADHSLVAVFTEEPMDVTPPVITINEPTARDYLHSETMTLDFTAEDTESGVASIFATLNGMTVETGDTIELYSLPLGAHTLTVTATDNVGNSNTETVTFNVVATVDSLIALVEKFYDLGYINDEDFVEGLLAKLYAAKAKIESGQAREAKNYLKSARNILDAFVNQVNADMHVAAEAASILISDVDYVKNNL